jgi:ABC-2 type transport system ATP-binding protein
MQEVEAICDRVLILDKGRIVADSPTHELLHRKGGGLSVRVRFRDPCPAEALENLQGVRRVQAYPDHWLVEGEHGALPETLFYEAVRQHNPLLELRPVSESLESVFQALTRSENEEAGSEPQAEAASSEPSSS